MKLKPILDRIIVKVIEDQETKGGIIIPDIAKKKPKRGKIIAAGLGLMNKKGKITPLEAKRDDIVLFTQFAGQEVSIDREKYLIMKESDILAIVKN